MLRLWGLLWLHRSSTTSRQLGHGEVQSCVILLEFNYALVHASQSFQNEGGIIWLACSRRTWNAPLMIGRGWWGLVGCILWWRRCGSWWETRWRSQVLMVVGFPHSWFWIPWVWVFHFEAFLFHWPQWALNCGCKKFKIIRWVNSGNGNQGLELDLGIV